MNSRVDALHRTSSKRQVRANSVSRDQHVIHTYAGMLWRRPRAPASMFSVWRNHLNVDPLSIGFRSRLESLAFAWVGVFSECWLPQLDEQFTRTNQYAMVTWERRFP